MVKTLQCACLQVCMSLTEVPGSGGSVLTGYSAPKSFACSIDLHRQAYLQPACLQVCVFLVQCQALHNCQRGCDHASAVQLALTLATFPLQSSPSVSEGLVMQRHQD